MADADDPRRNDPADESLGDVDLGALFGLAAQLESQLAEATEEVTDAEIEGVAGGGVVRITVTGDGEFRSVHIDSSAVDPDDVDLLEDLVLAALHDATRRVRELRTRELGALGGGLGDLLGGLGGQGDLGVLGGLFSGGEARQLLGAEADADAEGDQPGDENPPTHRG